MQLAQRMCMLGTETAFEVLARAEFLKTQGRDVINLGIGQPDFKTPLHIVEAAVKALRDGQHGYTPAPGIPALRKAIAADISKYRNVEVDPDCIVVMPGGKPTIFFAMLMFGEPGAEIIYPNPGFPIYQSAIEFSGAKAIAAPLSEEHDFSFDVEALLEQLTPATRLMVLNFPANPTGGVAMKSEMDRLAEGLDRFPQVVILSDEIYSRITHDNADHVSLLNYPQLRERLIMLDGFSKTYAMTGWRLGYSVWPQQWVEHATRLAINCHSCVNTATQYAGIAALKGPQDSVDSMVKTFMKRRKLIVSGLNAIDGMTCRMPGGAFYAFPNITETGKSAGDLQDLFIEKAGVATVAGTSFGHLGEGYIRFSYAASTSEIETALRRIGDLDLT